MAYPNYKLLLAFPLFPKTLKFPIFMNLLFLFCLLPQCTNSLSFNFPSFDVTQTYIELDLDARIYDTSIYLTRNPKYGQLKNSVGRAWYRKAVQLWEMKGNTIRLADFTSHFSFQIRNDSSYDGTGHGLAFFIVAENADWYPDKGRLLGLFSYQPSAIAGTSENKIVAVEFDTFGNFDEWNETRSHHIGIDVNSIVSKAYVNVTGGLVNRGTTNVQVTYNSTTKNLSASLSFAGSLKSFDVSHIVDLSVYLPQRVKVGFTAATADYVEIHELYSWSFNSSIDEPPPKIGNKVPLVVGITVGLSAVILITGVALFYWFRSRRKKVQSQIPIGEIPLIHDQQPMGVTRMVEDLGPKKFSYSELHDATNGFAKEMTLGKGGFGDVFEGTLASSYKVAVKRFRSGSNQGESEYLSEISVISRLKHKNLVQLKGWCHENGELLLVYDFMPNRSLDIHIFGKDMPILTWQTRHKIVLGLASALHYLQDGSDPGVIHRDIKSSNVMLDSNFNAKLGDFGLAKLTNHDISLTPTIGAGTLGYLAPEVIIKGKVSKASDIYSFGVVALELASGRRPFKQSERDPNTVDSITEWVWDLYTKGLILEVIDKKLNGECDKDQARRLIVVGLWCCHPDAGHRPSIKQVIDALNFEGSEPNVPLMMPAPTYIPSLMNMSLTSSSVTGEESEAGSTTRETQVSTSTTTTVTTTTNNM